MDQTITRGAARAHPAKRHCTYASTLLNHVPTKIWTNAQILLFGAMLSLGKRTSASTLSVMGLGGDYDFANYHHVLIRAVFSLLQLSRFLLLRGKPGNLAVVAVMRNLLVQLNTVARRGTPRVPKSAPMTYS